MPAKNAKTRRATVPARYVMTDGGPLGLVSGLSIEKYHDDAQSVSSTGLLDLARSPLHYHARHINSDRPPRETTATQLAGTLMHVAALEPETFTARYAIGPTCNRNTKRWHEFVESEADRARISSTPVRVCIQPEQWDVAQAQALSLRSITELAPLLVDGEAEASAYWIDPATDVRCRCRPDYSKVVSHPMRGAVLTDLKTCGDASDDEFARQISRMSYHVQAAFYSDGYEAATGIPVIGFVFGAVEDRWPFAANAVMLDDESLELGRREVRRLLARYAECKAANAWPGYSGTIGLVRLSAWRFKQENGS